MGEEYIAGRLELQINYYDRKSFRCQREFHTLSVINIVILALIPVISIAADNFSSVKYLVAAASATASILSSILLLKKSKENWVEFRATCEALKSEREKFRYAAGPYKVLPSPERDARFIERCEDIMSKEHSDWFSRIKNDAAQV